MSLYLGWWAYPIYGTDGDYLKLMKDTLSDAGEWNEAWNLTDDKKNMLKNSSGELFIKHKLCCIRVIRPCYMDFI